jgi:RNase H-fold protein (predicted Holliday junction resolvase)
MRTVVGLDPGTRKAGLAVVDAEGVILAREIVAIEHAADRAAALAAAHAAQVVAVGSGTNTAALASAVRARGLTVVTVDERETTYRARALYFEQVPPRGWRRWIPRGLLVPPVPIDDFAAVLIARRYLGR